MDRDEGRGAGGLDREARALQVEQVKTFEQTFDLDLLLANFGTVQAGGADVGDYDNDGFVADTDLSYLLTVLGLNHRA